MKFILQLKMIRTQHKNTALIVFKNYRLMHIGYNFEANKFYLSSLST